MAYDFKEKEKKWQNWWREQKTYCTHADGKKEPYYALMEFPYPSGQGLHVGHPRGFTAMDIVARKRRMEGYDVLFPVGWDAFGLPTENYAIKTGTPPAEVTRQNIATFTRQLQSLGFSFDWDREVNTTDPAYYRWTQWMFLQFYKHGLAYKATSTINWCPSCKTGLANEEVVAGGCERCGALVVQKQVNQWMLRIAKYAQRLIDDLDLTSFPDHIKQQQINWIGRTEGVDITFMLSFSGQENARAKIAVYTTRPETLFGVTFLAVSPEVVSDWTRAGWTAPAEVAQFVSRISTSPTSGEAKKEGVPTGVDAVHPYTGEHVPVWVVNYVVDGVGTGAVMGVPAHDERDWEFAQAYHVPIKKVIEAGQDNATCWSHDDEGSMVSSSILDGMTIQEARDRIIDMLVHDKKGRIRISYKLRDWVFSRQRYWGEPIPMVHSEQLAQRTQKVLLVHGFDAGIDKNWFPWTKSELEKRGFEVYAPQLPDPSAPQLESWCEVLVPVLKHFGSHDIILAHSLGAKAVLHALERASVHVRGVFLVGTTLGDVEGKDWERARAAWHNPDADFERARAIWEAPLDWDHVGACADIKRIVISSDDPYLQHPQSQHYPHGWILETWEGFGHFQAKVIPELVDLVEEARHDGWMPISESDLPLVLPEVSRFEPTDDGQSPLSRAQDWVHTRDAQWGDVMRETDTMPSWAGSSWYFLRYIDPHNNKAFADHELLKKFMPVDWYNGGMEHTTLHLLYSRFWYKFLWDIGAIPRECGPEPYMRRSSHGMILGENGEKMSKSRGNVVNPDEMVEAYGADAVRLYEMFMGPFDQAIPWSTQGLVGCQRFLDKWHQWASMAPSPTSSPEALKTVHQLIAKVTTDIEEMRFNTSIAACMSALNVLVHEPVALSERLLFAQVLAPFAPHVTEDAWQSWGQSGSIHVSPWPLSNSELAAETSIRIVIQVNGKVRATVTCAPDIHDEELKNLATTLPEVKRWITGDIRTIIVVPGKLVNIVV